MKHALILLLTTVSAVPALAQSGESDPDKRAAAIEAKMTDAERFQLLHGIMPIVLPELPPIPAGLKPTAGYIQGVPRLGVPDIYESDASLGVVNPLQQRKGDVSTALPSSLLLAATFDTGLAFRSGAVIGNEARSKGFNVLLSGGANLARDPHNGRNFEYAGEDPLLAGRIVGASIRGVQSEHVVSTIKHFALNGQETLRFTLDARIDEAGLRESDLLAFEIAIEDGRPGSVMCAYNLVNGAYACGNDFLLNKVLKTDWRYPGWVMSDWGAVHDVSFFANGLDQQSGSQIDKQVWFDKPLQAEVAAGRVPKARVSESVRRILRSLYAVGADKVGEFQPDFAAHALAVREVASAGIVLLKNEGDILPLVASAKSILVIGGHADIGVMSGGGSSQVTPAGPVALLPVGGRGMMANWGKILIMPSSPMKALRAAMPATTIEYDSGYVPEDAAAFASHADIAIVFATQWQAENIDSSLTLPEGQDALIEAVAKANPNTIVVLETGNPVKMPWLSRVKAVVEAWYPGQEGGGAIADVLTGKVNPGGRLPLTFPVDESQLPRPDVVGRGRIEKVDTATIEYPEGADVGYRWYAAKGLKPLFAFGHGLSYTNFAYSALRITGGQRPKVTFTVANTGKLAGTDVPQLYLTSAAGTPVRRLVGFDRVALLPGESKAVTVTIDPRLLAEWKNGAFQRRAGSYGFALGRSAEEPVLQQSVKLSAASDR